MIAVNRLLDRGEPALLAAFAAASAWARDRDRQAIDDGLQLVLNGAAVALEPRLRDDVRLYIDAAGPAETGRGVRLLASCWRALESDVALAEKELRPQLARSGALVAVDTLERLLSAVSRRPDPAAGMQAYTRDLLAHRRICTEAREKLRSVAERSRAHWLQLRPRYAARMGEDSAQRIDAALAAGDLLTVADAVDESSAAAGIESDASILRGPLGALSDWVASTEPALSPDEASWIRGLLAALAADPPAAGAAQAWADASDLVLQQFQEVVANRRVLLSALQAEVTPEVEGAGETVETPETLNTYCLAAFLRMAGDHAERDDDRDRARTAEWRLCRQVFHDAGTSELSTMLAARHALLDCERARAIARRDVLDAAVREADLVAAELRMSRVWSRRAALRAGVARPAEVQEEERRSAVWGSFAPGMAQPELEHESRRREARARREIGLRVAAGDGAPDAAGAGLHADDPEALRKAARTLSDQKR